MRYSYTDLKLVRMNTLERSDHERDVCILEVHHIDRDHGNADIDNLVLLCPTCHVVRHYLAQDGKFKKKKGAMV